MFQVVKLHKNVYDWGSKLTYEQEKEYTSQGYHVFHFYSGTEAPELAFQKIVLNKK